MRDEATRSLDQGAERGALRRAAPATLRLDAALVRETRATHVRLRGRDRLGSSGRRAGGSIRGRRDGGCPRARRAGRGGRAAPRAGRAAIGQRRHAGRRRSRCATTPPGRTAPFVYVPRNVRVEAPIVLTTVREQAGTSLHRRAARRARGGRRGARCGTSRLSSDDDAEGLVNGVVELVVGANARLRYVDDQALNEKTWVFGAQRARWIATARWTGSRSASARATARSSQETQLAGPGAHGNVTGAYASRGPPAPRLRHLAGARRAEHHVRPGVPRESSPAARARSGAA